MTVSSTVFRNDYTGNGVTTAFTGGFRILDEAHIQVLRTQISTGVVTTLALTTDYTVAGVGNSTFTVTALAAPTSDQRLSILRDVPLTQETDYVEGDPFPAASHESALDKLTMVAQQQQEQQARSVTLPANSTGIDPELPTPVALNILGWDSAGTGLTNYDAESLAGSVAIVNWSSETFDGDGSTLDFILAAGPGSVANTDVAVGGVVQRPNVDYTLSGATISFLVAPGVGTDNVLVRYGTTLPTGTPGDGTVTEAKLAVGAVTETKIGTGAVTAPKLGTSAVTTVKINDQAVTYAKIQNVTDARLLGRSAGSAGAPQEITVGAGLRLSGGALSGAASGGNRSMVRLHTSNGHGSTNTAIRRFSTVVVNTGADITYADSAANGASFTINADGIYSISYCDAFSASGRFGLSLNSSQLTTGLSSITTADRLMSALSPAANNEGGLAWTGFLSATDVIRPHTEAGAAAAVPALTQFIIVRVA